MCIIDIHIVCMYLQFSGLRWLPSFPFTCFDVKTEVGLVSFEAGLIM